MSENADRYFIVHKPYNMVSQFISPDNVGLLGDLDFEFPEGIHAIGRLDSHSEGLLILTTNKKVTRLLFQSEVPHKRTYLVQVKNVVSPETLEQLKTGVHISAKKDEEYFTKPLHVEIVKEPLTLFKYAKGFYDNFPHTWLLITLTEGKFHQVRKMVKAVSHRCQRLIRVSIEDLMLGDLEPGCIREIEEHDFFGKLKIDH
ncbi:MAG: pseudouridine synthase [Panacibacter sp.]